MVYGKKGKVVRLLYLLVSMCIWLFSLGGRAFRSKVVVLCYHGVTDYDRSRFSRQIASISQKVLTLSCISSGEPRLSKSPKVVLTFDDAFENLVRNVIPVINEYQVPISIYVVTGCMGSKPVWLKDSKHRDEFETLMSASKIKELSKNSLISFGIHTHTHPKLTDISTAAIHKEIKISKCILEDLLNQEVSALAFPHGEFNSTVLKIALSHGLTQLLTLDAKIYPMGLRQDEVARFSMSPNVWPLEFRLTVDGCYSWLFFFRGLVRWLKKKMRK